jgi:CRP-like cAMP-binding protein
VLAEDQLQVIDQAKNTRRFRAGESIYNQGEACEGIFCIEAGNVAIRLNDESGSSKIVRMAGAGQTLGYADFFAGKGYRTSAYCLAPTTVCHIAAGPLREVLGHNPALGLAFLAHSAEDLQHADAMSAQQALYTVRMRLAHMVLSFKDVHGAADDEGQIAVTLPMSWQEAAELIGARPETVSRASQALEQDKILSVNGRIILIRDLDLLLDELEPAEPNR